MCNGLHWQQKTIQLMSSLTPASPSSLTPAHGMLEEQSGIPSSIPRVLFIPTENSMAQSNCSPLIRFSQRATGYCKDDDAPQVGLFPQTSPLMRASSECSSSIPRIPQRQASIGYEPLVNEHHGFSALALGEKKDETSPRIPRRQVSVHDFDAWLEEGSVETLSVATPKKEETAEAPKKDVVVMSSITSCSRRHSCPEDILEPDHFQYISDPEAGGKCPKLPRRRGSISTSAAASASPARLRSAQSGYL